MNRITLIHEVEDRIDEIQWLLRSLKADIKKGAGPDDLRETVSDIGYQAGQIEMNAQALARGIR